MKKYRFTGRMTNTVEPAAPASIWGKGVPGKGGVTTNGAITEKQTDKEDK